MHDTLCDKVCRWQVGGFSPCTPVSSTNEIDRHTTTEKLLKPLNCPAVASILDFKSTEKTHYIHFCTSKSKLVSEKILKCFPIELSFNLVLLWPSSWFSYQLKIHKFVETPSNSITYVVSEKDI